MRGGYVGDKIVAYTYEVEIHGACAEKNYRLHLLVQRGEKRGVDVLSSRRTGVYRLTLMAL